MLTVHFVYTIITSKYFFVHSIIYGNKEEPSIVTYRVSIIDCFVLIIVITMVYLLRQLNLFIAILAPGGNRPVGHSSWAFIQ